MAAPTRLPSREIRMPSDEKKRNLQLWVVIVCVAVFIFAAVEAFIIVEKVMHGGTSHHLGPKQSSPFSTGEGRTPDRVAKN
jgi:hypothetical protein